MRILQTIESLDPAFGGTVEAVLQLTRAFATLGVRADILTLDGPDQTWETGLAPDQVHRVGPPRTFYRYCAGLAPWLGRHLPEFDVVLIHGLWRHHSAGTWLALRRTPRPYFVLVHSMLNPWFNSTGAMKHLRKAAYWRLIEHRTLRDARAVIYSSEEERNLARDSFRPYCCREEICPLGTADPLAVWKPQADDFLAAFPRLAGKRIVLFLGRLHPVKGCDTLIRAWAPLSRSYPDAVLVMTGPDTQRWRPELEALATATCAPDSVVWTGPLFGSAKFSALVAAEALVLPSHCESTAFSVLEALALRRPAIVSGRVNTHSRLAAHECVLVGPPDEVHTRANLERFLAMAPSRRAEMGERGRCCFLRHFESGGAANSLLALLEDRTVGTRA